jgi:MFS family permease/quinol monooxygenase YgiN
MLWVAGLVSDIGAWMHEVAEAWLMTSLSSSPLLVGFVQSADGLAIFLLALPAGALADVVDRRKLAIATQAWLMVTALLLGILTLTHHMTPWRLIGLVFMMGVGAALDGPVWQAIVPEVVPQSDLPAAVTLGGLSFNVARAVGPTLGGLVVAAAGPFAVFLLNAVSFACVLVALVAWKRPPSRTTLPAERWLGAMRSGLRFVRNSTDLVAAFVRTGAYVLGSSSLLALLPLIARRQLGLGSFGYGALMGCMGAGAVASAMLLLPRLQRRLSTEAILGAGALVHALALLGVATADDARVAGAAAMAAGVASMLSISSLNVAVQMASPHWIRARVLSVYLLVFQGAIALGSALWGATAARFGLRTGLLAAAVTVGAGLTLRLRYGITGETHDFSPSAHWPKPMLVCEPSLEAGPVMVTIEFRVPPANASEFIQAATELGRQRRRFGALQWELFRDPATPDRFVETYFVESWADHLRQHERVSVEEQAAERRLRALAKPGVEPVVTHLVAASGEVAERAAARLDLG